MHKDRDLDLVHSQIQICLSIRSNTNTLAHTHTFTHIQTTKIHFLLLNKWNHVDINNTKMILEVLRTIYLARTKMWATLTFWMVPIYYLEDPKQFVNQLQFCMRRFQGTIKLKEALESSKYLMSLYNVYKCAYRIFTSHTHKSNVFSWCCKIFMDLKFL